LNISTFAELNLAEPILRAVLAENYTIPTPIQAKCIPPLLEKSDILGIAQTGTGKTAAFSLPLLHHIAIERPNLLPKKPLVLILAPTRELAVQIGDSVKAYGKFIPVRHAVVYGGVGQGPQVKALQAGIHILVATPGRLMDLMQQGFVDLSSVKTLVLDEADRMLDMGFINDIRRIAAKIPAQRHTLMFSATMPKEIAHLADSLLREPVRINVAPTSEPAERVEQRVVFIEKKNKLALLSEILADPAITRALVFARTKHGADRLSRQLERLGINADAIHGDKAQNARQRALNDFKSGAVRILVATDIAARGIDVDDISHVINYDLPQEPESYVHRIGRTARAGASGIALSFCDETERDQLRLIEMLIRREIPVVENHPYHSAEVAAGGSGAIPKGSSRSFRPGGGRRGRPSGRTTW